MPSALLGLLVAAPFAVGAAVTPQAPHGTTVFTFRDPAIVEASALVKQGKLFLTTNDSGDTGRVFVVNRSGATVGVTHWSPNPSDVEALASAGRGFVWVGDVGDNLARRPHITLTRIPVGRKDRTVRRTSYRLTYPRGATNAETLLRNPRTGRLYVATKNVFGGTLYAVPRHLEKNTANRLKKVGPVLSMATDGSFFPDGRHLVVRNYSSATVYAWPSLARVGSFDLPSQPQGEGLAVGPRKTLYLSSEGVRSTVVETRVPRRIRRAMTARVPASAPSSVSAASSSARGSDPSEPSDAAAHDAWPWALGGLLALGAGVVLVRALRPPAHHTRRPSG